MPNPARAMVITYDVFGLDFRINNPGARANAMGGAFIGLADDASAAYANPAGLTILTRPELSIEYKYGEDTNTIYDFPDPGVLRQTDYTEKNEGVSFISYVYPREKMTLALYRHQLASINSRYDWQYGALPWHNSVQIDAVTYGLGAGFKVIDSLSLGLSLDLTDFTYSSMATQSNDPLNPLLDSDEFHTSGSEKDSHYTVSTLWNPLSELNVGLVYRQGPEMTAATQWDTYDGTYFQKAAQLPNRFKVPDIFGAGLSYRFANSLTIAADAVYIEYSDLLDVYLEFDPSGLKLQMDDEIEYHLGLEYILEAGSLPLALRAGYNYKPIARIFIDAPYARPEFEHMFGDKDEVDHIFSLGLGVAIDNIQIDLAGAIGDYTKEGSASLVYRFE